MKNNHILFVINPKSGGNDKTGLDKFIDKVCKKQEVDFKLFYTTGENDLEKIKKSISEHSPKIVVACGGDGTVNMVAKALLNTDLILGIMPLGSANGMASEFEIPEDEEDSLDIILTGEAKALDVVQINNEHISLHLSDVGFNAKMIKEFEEEQGRGKLGYAKAFFRSILNRESETYTIKTDQENFEVTAEMLVFANASSYGTGAVINPDSDLNDGLFEVIVFKPIPLSDFPSLTFESFFGDIKDSPYVEIHQMESATIICKEQQLLQVDGELMGEVEEIELKVLPAALKVIRP
ncbi:diacylglycerol kinase family lipid kinase [Marivirga atlantica]|jgi:YegS/Rv2252/BmrU family lipid kinase|uniref:Diacylglycerol kinase family lipid kinase n=1 Tax=Marivirga atlantica TaxID=1548457 RepID=A0A937ABL5_9BACT|nr:diacylglycerol kinase family protein [Marivirga atlantica]MBL0763636.1 diacylglycerol kinase family lipid kinase [Marivirga atlantica]